MQCLEQLIGAETQFAIIAVAVGAIMNGVKRIKFVPGDAVPVLAFVLGWLVDAAIGNRSCGLSLSEAALSGLGGGLAGLAAAGGHEALSRVASKFGLAGIASKILGKAAGVKAGRVSTGLIVFGVAMLAGCGTLLPALAKAAQGAQYLGTVIEVADSGQRAYFARHPNQNSEARVAQALRNAHGALTALNGALAAAEAVEQDDVVRARVEALAAYKALKDLLGELGVLSATPPAGGAETDAPAPEPFDLPEPDQVL